MSCSKKDDPVPPARAGTGSYTYDGTWVNCQVSADTTYGVTTAGVTTGKRTDYLQVVLQPSPQLPTGESVRVEYAKSAGQPTATYTLSSITYFSDNHVLVGNLHTSNATGTITETSKGRFAGTFSGTDFSTPAHTITAGAFTQVSL